jgi:hypothetical protein
MSKSQSGPYEIGLDFEILLVFSLGHTESPRI